MSLFGNRLKYVTAKVWDTTRPGFEFPEVSDPELKVKEIAEKPDLGLAISGGGTRAATATLGQLRGLYELGILQKARYLSCVSGSSFTSTAFTYLPSSRPDAHFLGPVVDPQDVTKAHLSRTEPGSFADAVANSYLVDDLIKNAARLAGDETYARAIGDNFLLPFGLDSLKRFFTLDKKSLSAILEHNPKMKDQDFYRTHSERPFIIINAIVLRPDNEGPHPKKLPLETTPLYSGVRPLYRGAGSHGRDIGGGYVEPFGFDSEAPDDSPDASGRVALRLGVSRHRYTLSDAIGTSGAAPAESIAESGLSFLGFPEFRYWSPARIGKVEAKEYEFGDGGNLENLGIMPLLARRVKRIIVFINTHHPLKGSGPGEINGSIPPIFGQTPEFMDNAVLPPSKYESLVAGLMAAKAEGRSVLYKDHYQVQDNEFHAIQGGWEVEILWVYNERVPEWERELSAGISEMIGRDTLENFPHYRTYGQNRPAIIVLKPEQIFLLANLSCWNIVSNANLFRSMLG